MFTVRHEKTQIPEEKEIPVFPINHGLKTSKNFLNSIPREERSKLLQAAVQAAPKDMITVSHPLKIGK